MSDLTKCPACGYRSFDPWCDSCERRKCGYVAPVAATDDCSQSSPKAPSSGREDRKP